MKVFGLITIAVAITLLGSADARACGCPGLPPDAGEEAFTAAVAKEYKNAAAVFSGEVIAYEYKPVVETSTDSGVGEEVLVVRMAAERRWKGGPITEVILYTKTFRHPDGSGPSNSCDYNFEKGKRYLVFAFGRPDELSTHACSGTKLMRHAGRDIKALDEIKKNEKANERQ